MKAKVLGINEADNFWNLALDNQSVNSTRKVIIAMGNPPPLGLALSPIRN